MKKKHRLTRREFLGQTGAAALGAVALGGDVAAQTRSVAPPQAIGANDLIDLAVIGHGMRGPQLIDQIRGLPRGAGARIAAVCEIYDRRKESIQRQARLSECVHDYRDLLAMDSIDARHRRPRSLAPAHGRRGDARRQGRLPRKADDADLARSQGGARRRARDGARRADRRGVGLR
jgi:hypothetical protein